MDNFSPPDSFLDGSHPLNDWLAARQRLILAIIVFVSLAVRVTFFVEFSQGPCIWFHRWDQTDMNLFHQWARRIVAGDWLTDNKFCPDHSWYQTVGNQFLEEHPELRPEIEQEAKSDGVSPSRAVWNRWYNNRFHQDPLYPYLLALTYKVLGEDPRWMLVWQLLCGVATNVLIYLIARRCFGHLVGVVAAVLACLCGTLLFYEAILLRESLIVCAGLALVLMGDAVRNQPKVWMWLLFGLAIGISSLLKNIFLPFWLFYLAMFGWQSRRAPWTWARAAAASFAGLLLAFSVVFARNAVVGAPLFGLAGTGSTTYVCTNAADVNLGMQSGGPVSFEHLPRIMGRTEGRFWPTISETLKTHPSVTSYLGLLATKFGMMWTWYEVPDNCSFYHFKLHCRVLNWMPVTYFLISPLAFVGLGLALPRWRESWPLYAYFLSLAALMMVFCSMSRWRLPLVAAAIPFASFSMIRISTWLLYGQLTRGLPALLALMVVAVFTSLPLPAGVSSVRPADCRAAFQLFYLPEATKAQGVGDTQRAIDLFHEFVHRAPESVRRLHPSRPARYDYEVELAELYAEANATLARMLADAGQLQASLVHRQRAEELTRAADLPWPEAAP